jgi:hypothetical protein
MANGNTNSADEALRINMRNQGFNPDDPRSVTKFKRLMRRLSDDFDNHPFSDLERSLTPGEQYEQERRDFCSRHPQLTSLIMSDLDNEAERVDF